jgi:hypothetical protein
MTAQYGNGITRRIEFDGVPPPARRPIADTFQRVLRAIGITIAAQANT